LAFSEARESIRTPLFTADAVADEEEAGGIVIPFTATNLG